jgi:hypothetical protein
MDNPITCFSGKLSTISMPGNQMLFQVCAEIAGEAVTAG